MIMEGASPLLKGGEANRLSEEQALLSPELWLEHALDGMASWKEALKERDAALRALKEEKELMEAIDDAWRRKAEAWKLSTAKTLETVKELEKERDNALSARDKAVKERNNALETINKLETERNGALRARKWAEGEKRAAERQAWEDQLRCKRARSICTSVQHALAECRELAEWSCAYCWEKKCACSVEDRVRRGELCRECVQDQCCCPSGAEEGWEDSWG